MGKLSSVHTVIFAISLFLAVRAYAQEIQEIEIPPDISEEELEKAVTARDRYINNLLTGKAAREIEESGDNEAIEILQRVRVEKAIVDEQISGRRYKDALKGLHRLNLYLMDALKIIGVEDRRGKRLEADLETARVTNDTYFEMAEKKNVKAAGEEAVRLFNKAKEMRLKADKLIDGKKYSEAHGFLEASTDQLKKAIAITRKNIPSE